MVSEAFLFLLAYYDKTCPEIMYYYGDYLRSAHKLLTLTIRHKLLSQKVLIFIRIQSPQYSGGHL